MSDDSTTTLDIREERALGALLATSTVREAALMADIGEATLHRWLSRPDFKAAYRSARRDLTEKVTARLQAIACDAADALHRVVTDVGAPPSVTVAAARTIIELAQKGLALDDLAARVEALEEERTEAPHAH
jgi:hypothetical protein